MNWNDRKSMYCEKLMDGGGWMYEERPTNWLALWAPGKNWLTYLQNIPPFFLILKKAWKFFAGIISARVFICFVGYGNFTNPSYNHFNGNVPFRPVIQQHWETRKDVPGIKLVEIHSCYVVVFHLRALHSLAHRISFSKQAFHLAWQNWRSQ